MSRNNVWGLWVGVGLIGLGVVFLLGQFLRFDIMRYLWPFFILAAGAAFFVGMVAGGRDMGALAVPGSVISTVGLILLFQNIFSLWATWSYAWALIIAGAGVGLIIFGRWSDVPDLRNAGRVVIAVGLSMFFIFGLFFEFGASLLGLRSPGGIFWPLALILVGLYALFGRALFERMSGPVQHSTLNFSPSGEGRVQANWSTAGAERGLTPAADSLPMTGVRRISFHALGDLTVLQGEREGLEIAAPEAVRERIRSEVRGDTLEIRYEPDWLDWLNPRFWNLSPIRYYVYVRDVEMICSAGLGNLSVPQLVTRRFELNHSGTGNVNIQRLEATELVIDQSGLGTVDVDGSVDRQDVNLSGTGSYHARRLESREAVVRLSGLGSAIVRVAESMDAQVSGTGSIEYVGSPRTGQRVSGLGSVRRVG